MSTAAKRSEVFSLSNIFRVEDTRVSTAAKRTVACMYHDLLHASRCTH